MNPVNDNLNYAGLMFLAELVYEDMLALIELPSFLSNWINDTNADDKEREIGEELLQLCERGLAFVFETTGESPIASSQDQSLHLSLESVRTLVARPGWIHRKSHDGNLYWVAATKLGTRFCEEGSDELKRALGTYRPESDAGPSRG